MSSLFEKATLKQKYIKCCVHGEQGSGKTLTLMDCADGIAKIEKGTFCLIQNEVTGSEFYSIHEKNRKLHPEAFDYSVCVTKSIMTAVKAAQEAIADKNIKAIVVDSLTKYLDDAKKVYGGEKNAAGSIKIHKWNKIREEYNAFVDLLLECDKHVFFTARSANVYEAGKDDNQVKTGTKAKVGADTAYEAQTVLRFEQKLEKNGTATIRCFGEKDRTSTIQNTWIEWPCFKNTIGLILPKLSKKQVKIEDKTESDRVIAARKEAEFSATSEKGFKIYKSRISECTGLDELEIISSEITAKAAKFLDEDMTALQEMYVKRKGEFSIPDEKLLKKLQSPI